MLLFIGKRLLWLIPVVLGVSILIFVITSFTPGDPVQVMLGSLATEEQKDEVRAELGLDQPMVVQYFDYMKGLVTRGDLGKSYITKESVMSQILKRIPFTISISFISMFIAILTGIPLGVFAATHQNTWRDNISILISIIMVSIPGFWLALEFTLLFSVKLGWLPAVGVSTWKHFVMPCLACAMPTIASLSRLTRTSMLEVVRQDYITTALAKGLTRRAIVYKHSLKNALIPVIMAIGNAMAMTLGGALVVETIFSVPGMGIFMMNAIHSRDYPVIRGSSLVISVFFCLVMLLVDIMFALIDPRIRKQFTKGKVR